MRERERNKSNVCSVNLFAWAIKYSYSCDDVSLICDVW